MSVSNQAKNENRRAEHIEYIQKKLTERNATIARLAAEIARLKAEGDLEKMARAWDEGERHESDYLATWGQFCPNGRDFNPYRRRLAASTQ